MHDNDIIAFLHKHHDNRSVARLIAFHFMSKYPEEGANLMAAVDGPAPKASADAMVTVNIPNRADSNSNWTAASYALFPRYINEWMRIANSPRAGGVSSKVAAIKQCRNDTRLLLKEAKDLIEFLMESW